MVSNSTLTNKTNNLLILTKWTRKITTKYNIENPGPDFGQTQKLVGIIYCIQMFQNIII